MDALQLLEQKFILLVQRRRLSERIMPKTATALNPNPRESFIA